MNPSIQLKSFCEDGVTVEMYFEKKDLQETVKILEKFLIASGYTFEKGKSLSIVEETEKITLPTGSFQARE